MKKKNKTTKPKQKTHNPFSFSCRTQCEEIKVSWGYVSGLVFWIFFFFFYPKALSKVRVSIHDPKANSMHIYGWNSLEHAIFPAWCNCPHTVSSTKYILFYSCFHLFSSCLFMRKNDLSLHRGFLFSDIFVFPLNLLSRSQCCASGVIKAAR